MCTKMLVPCSVIDQKSHNGRYMKLTQVIKRTKKINATITL